DEQPDVQTADRAREREHGGQRDERDDREREDERLLEPGVRSGDDFDRLGRGRLEHGGHGGVLPEDYGTVTYSTVGLPATGPTQPANPGPAPRRRGRRPPGARAEPRRARTRARPPRTTRHARRARAASRRPRRRRTDRSSR